MSKIHTLKSAKASRSDPNEIYLSGDVGDYGWEDDFSAKVVIKQLDEMEGDITIRLNSGGGIVLEGFAIYNAIKSYPGKVTIIVDVLAASIASYIAMAADTVLMHPNSKIMIHNPWNYIEGDAEAMRKGADELDMFCETIVDGYHDKTGMSKESLKELVAKTTWLTAEQAMELGFADGYVELPAKNYYPSTAVAKIKSSTKLNQLPEAVKDHMKAFIESQEEIIMAKHTGIKNEEVKVEEEEIVEAVEVVEEALVALESGEEVEESDLEEIIALIESLGDQVEDPMAFIKEAVAKNLTLSQAQASLIDRIAMKNQKPVRRNAASAKASVQTDSVEKSTKAIENALQAKAGLVQMDKGNPHYTATLFDLAKASLQANGTDVSGLNRNEIVGRALTARNNYSRSDFPALLTGCTNLIFMKGFEETETSYQEWTSKINLQDGRPTTLANLGPISNLQVIPENAEYPELRQGSGSETFQLRKEGGLVTISREMILDDMVHAFSANPKKAGQAAKRSIQLAVTNILVSNPNMGDGAPLFSVANGNYLTGASSALSVTSLALAQQKMWEQTDRETGTSIDATPAFLIVPPALGALAHTLMGSQYDPAIPATPTFNPVAGIATVIVDRNLKDPTAWYLVADGKVDDVVGIGYRDGNDVPYLEEIEHPTRDQISLKVRMELDAGPLHYAGMVKSKGKA